jgi:alpha-beta hydrolase superfamily lysophospholipase
MKFQTKDGLQLFCKHWEFANPKAVIALIHGLGEHSGRYNHWAKMFNQEGYAVVGLDLRGHGHSDGKKGFVPHYDSLLDDIDVFLSEIKKLYPTSKIVLYGHSLGGSQVLNYLLRKNHNLDAVIATAPFITLAFKPNPALLLLGKLIVNISPGFTQNNQLDTKALSKDAAVVEAYENDILVHDRLSTSLGIGSLEAGKFLYDYKGEVKTPTLLLHGSEDKTTNPEGTVTFYNNTTGNRTLKLFPNLFHEIHNEPEQKEVFAYILNWLKIQEI